jgi:hypothetical protein
MRHIWQLFFMFVRDGGRHRRRACSGKSTGRAQGYIAAQILSQGFACEIGLQPEQACFATEERESNVE